VEFYLNFIWLNRSFHCCLWIFNFRISKHR
jgi:hypothetical protein